MTVNYINTYINTISITDVMLKKEWTASRYMAWLRTGKKNFT